MRRILTVIVGLCSIFAPAALVFASSIGNTIPDSQQEAMSFSVGIEDNFISERKIDDDGSMTGGKVENSNETYATATFQPFNFMTVYGKVGVANLEEKFDWDVNRSQKIKFDYGVLLGGGLNLLYSLNDNLGIGWDNQMEWSHNDADSVSGDNSPNLTDKGSVDNVKFQSTIYGKYDFKMGEDKVLTPYVGGYYLFNKSYIDEEIKVTDNTYIYTYGDAKNKDHFGPLVGVNYKLGKNFLLGVEGRFVSETSVIAGMSYKF